MDAREMRGLEIARTTRITRSNSGWIVPSQSGHGKYLVTMNEHEQTCTCPDCKYRRLKCKHIIAVEYISRKEIYMNGKETVTKTMKVTYAQNWQAYNQAQTQEGQLFMKLLVDLCNNIEQPTYKFGRPTLPLADMIFASALKVYSTFSLRRFISFMRIATEKGYMNKTCSYSTVSNYMGKKEMTPILKKLIQISSLPLKTVETNFAVDSSGFSISRFARWFDFRYGKDKNVRMWIKAHIVCGTKTNVVTDAEISDARAGDSPFFTGLINQTAENFKIGIVAADKAYSSRKNIECVKKAGGMPYIAYRENSLGVPKGSKLWKKMWGLFMYNNQEFMKYYHKRSNVETTFHMIKTKFGDSVKSKTKTAQINEVLAKILCHNICVLIQEMHELGFMPNS